LDLIKYDSSQKAQEEDVRIQGTFSFVIRQGQVILTQSNELFTRQSPT